MFQIMFSSQKTWLTGVVLQYKLGLRVRLPRSMNTLSKFHGNLLVISARQAEIVHSAVGVRLSVHMAVRS